MSLPIIVPSKSTKSLVKSVPRQSQGQPPHLLGIEGALRPETAREIQLRKMKYPNISLLKKAFEGQQDENNKLIIEQLRALVEYIEDQIRSAENANDRKKHGFRLSSIKKGIDLLAEYPHKILSGRQARDIKGIGKGISERIDEILLTGRLAEIEEQIENGDDETCRIIGELTKVTGIGNVKARELMQKYDLDGVDDLIERWHSGLIKVGKHELTHHIEIGLRWHYDIQEKISREEMDTLSAILIDAGKRVDERLHIQICGSYRRGKSQSNDIDVLLTHPDLLTEPDVIRAEKYLPRMLAFLVDEGIIVDSITDPIRSPTKYMGVAKLHNDTTYRAHRIDIRFVPYESWASALQYFTGSGPFNKVFRGIALQRGYTLNEYGIYKLDAKGEKGEMIPTFTEEQIFEIVGVDYLLPHQRES